MTVKGGPRAGRTKRWTDGLSNGGCGPAVAPPPRLPRVRQTPGVWWAFCGDVAPRRRRTAAGGSTARVGRGSASAGVAGVWACWHGRARLGPARGGADAALAVENPHCGRHFPLTHPVLVTKRPDSHSPREFRRPAHHRLTPALTSFRLLALTPSLPQAPPRTFQDLVSPPAASVGFTCLTPSSRHVAADADGQRWTQRPRPLGAGQVSPGISPTDADVVRAP